MLMLVGQRIEKPHSDPATALAEKLPPLLAREDSIRADRVTSQKSRQ
jgi:hypothetical protein